MQTLETGSMADDNTAPLRDLLLVPPAPEEPATPKEKLGRPPITVDELMICTEAVPLPTGFTSWRDVFGDR